MFVAVTPPRDRLEVIDESLGELKAALAGARWSAVDNQHFTLKFLGSTEADRLDAVREVCAMVARSHAPAEVSFDELGVFASPRRVRVVWVGLADPKGLFAALAADLGRGFEPLGHPEEKRAYTPHLTVARFKTPRRLRVPLPELPLDRLPPFEAGTLRLYRSHLSPKGARYELLEEFPLTSADA